jgi:hypothetical protein
LWVFCNGVYYSNWVPDADLLRDQWTLVTGALLGEHSWEIWSIVLSADDIDWVIEIDLVEVPE